LRALTVTERRAPTQRTVTSVKRSAANDTKSTAADKKRPASSAAKKTTTTTTNTRTTSARTKPKEQVKERTKEKPKEQPAQQEVPTLNENRYITKLFSYLPSNSFSLFFSIVFAYSVMK
jgi:Mg-chelatase subunit ChlI